MDIVKTKGKKKAAEIASPASSSGNGEISRDDIAFAAYCLWEQEGRPDGRDTEHWLRAEDLLRKARSKAGVSDANPDSHS